MAKQTQTEILLENKTTLTKESGKEFLELTWSKNMAGGRVILFAVGVFAVGYACFQIYRSGMEAIGYAIAMLLLGAFSFFLGAKGFWLRVPFQARAQRKLWGGETLDKTLTFSEYGVRQTSKLGQLYIEYSKLTHYYEGKNLFILMAGKAALVMDKHAFTKGDISELKALLSRKCPAVRAKR